MGYSGSGKSTVCRLLETKYRLKCARGSMHYARDIIYPALSHTYGYETAFECWKDRRNHKEEWLKLICKYNASYPARSGVKIWSHHAVYSGLRDDQEYRVLKARKMFELSFWIDAYPRVPNEDIETITVGPHRADHVIRNFGTHKELASSLQSAMQRAGIAENTEESKW